MTWCTELLTWVRVTALVASLVVVGLALAVPLRHGAFFTYYVREVNYVATWPWLLAALAGLAVASWTATQLWRDAGGRPPASPG